MKTSFKPESVIVVLERVKIIGNLYLEKIANLDRGETLPESGELPEGKYCVFYRVGMDTHSYGMMYLTDWTGGGDTNLKDLIKLIG